MSYDPILVSRLSSSLSSVSGLRQRGVFGGRGFLLGKRTFLIAWGDDLLVKVPPSEYSSALAEPGTTPFSPDGGRPMGTWIVVGAEVIADDSELQAWVALALRAVR